MKVLMAEDPGSVRGHLGGLLAEFAGVALRPVSAAQADAAFRAIAHSRRAVRSRFA